MEAPRKSSGYRSYSILGDLGDWFHVLKSLGAAKNKTRNQLASMTGVTYNKFCRAFREQLLPLGIVEQDGVTRGRRGRATRTWRITERGRALVAAIEMVELKFGKFERQ